MVAKADKYKTEFDRADLRAVRDAVSDYLADKNDLQIEFDYRLNNLRKERDEVVREAYRNGATKAELGRALNTTDHSTLVRILTGK